MSRPFRILGPWLFSRICDSPDGARKIGKELDLKPGFVSVVKKECNNPAAKARRLGLPYPDNVSAILPAAVTLNENVRPGNYEQRHNRTSDRNAPGSVEEFTTMEQDEGAADIDEAGVDVNPYLGDHSPIPLIQPVTFSDSLDNPFKLASSALTTHFNSRMHAWATAFADRFTRPLLPDLFPPNNRENSTFERLLEIANKYLKNEGEKPAAITKVEDTTEESRSDNCSCAAYTGDSSIAPDALDQKNKRNTDNAGNGGESHEKETNTSEQALEKRISEKAEEATFRTDMVVANSPAIELPEQQDLSAKEPSNLTGNMPALPVPAPTVPYSIATNAPSSTFPPGPAITGKSGTNSESPQDVSPNKQFQEQRPLENSRSSNCSGMMKELLPVALILLRENKPPPLQLVDGKIPGNHALKESIDLGQDGKSVNSFVKPAPPVGFSPEPPVSVSATVLAPVSEQPSLNTQGSKRKSGCDLVGQTHESTGTNQNMHSNLEASDFLLPGILLGTAAALAIGGIVSWYNQNKNRQRETLPANPNRRDINEIRIF